MKEEIKIKVSTPKGKAKGVEKLLRKFAIGMLKAPSHTQLSKKDDHFIWTIKGNQKQIAKIIRKVSTFEVFIQQGILKIGMIKLMIKRLKEKEQKEFYQMLADTKVTIL